MIRHLPTSLYVVALAACAADVPDNPSFQEDVLPILAANCVRCHGSPPIGGAATFFRLDMYATSAAPDGDVLGAEAMAGVIALRGANEDRPMPPRFPLDDHQIELLQQWANNGTPGRGEPRPGNQRPVAVIDQRSEDGTLARLRIAVDDADGDIVGGDVRTRIGPDVRVIGLVQSGITELVWDTAGIPPGTYPLTGALDDGAAVHVIDLGTVVLTAPPSGGASARGQAARLVIGGS